MGWIARLSDTNKSLIALTGALLVGVSLGVSGAQMRGLPERVSANTNAIEETRQEVISRMDQMENALIFHMCEGQAETRTTLQACVATTRIEISRLNRNGGME